MNLRKPIRPKAGAILVKEYKTKEVDDYKDGFNAQKLESGLFVTSDTAENMLFKTAQVVAVGANTDNYTMECKVGDVVVVNKNMMTIADKTLRVNGVDHYWMTEEFGVFGWIDEE